MDLDARSLPDLERIQAICCTRHNKNATRAAIVDNIRSSQLPIMVLPCRAPKISAYTCEAALNLLRSLDWRAFAHNKYAGANRTASRGATNSANFVLGATKGVPGSRGFTHVVDKQHASDNLCGLNLSVVKTAGRRQAPKLLALWELLRQMVAAHDPAYDLTSVQVNRNFAGRVHRDRNDTTYQYALSLGDFTGGRLVVSTDDPCLYVSYDTHMRLTRCDGRHPHWVTKYHGDRYSLIFYNVTGIFTPRESNKPSGVRRGPAHVFGPDDQPRALIPGTHAAAKPQVCQTESTRKRPERCKAAIEQPQVASPNPAGTAAAAKTCC